jgi:hypothetical protein
MRIGTRANPQSVRDIGSVTKSRVQQTCTASQNVSQSSLCDIWATACPDLTVNCNNTAVQSFFCDLSAVNKIAEDAVSKEDPEGMAHALKLPKGASVKDIEQRITNSITQTCYAAQGGNQKTRAEFICRASKDVDINILQSMDQSAACSMGALVSTIQESRQYVADQFNAKQRQRVITWGSVVGVVYLLILIAIIVGVSRT